MLKVRDLFLREINLSEKQWKHIVKVHPEVEVYFSEIPNILKDPQHVKRSKSDPKIWLYYRFFPNIFSGKFLLVIVKHADHSFVVTYYITDKIKVGESIWQKE